MNKIINMIKKITVALFLCSFAISLSACGSAKDSRDDKIKIVCTTFPQYDWVRQILGDEIDNVDLVLLGNTGVDMHSYQATADDIIEITTSDIFIYVGGVSDSWVEDALAQEDTSDIIVINMMEVLGDRLKLEDESTGVVEDENHEHTDEESHEHINTSEYDEHVWLSIKNAVILCERITKALCEIDPDNKQIYTDNSNAYITQLNELDISYENTVKNAKSDAILFGDRFPFIYLVNDYDIEYYAAFSGCSTETEASFETITFLAEKLNDLDIPVVLVVEGSTRNLAKTVIDSSKDKNQDILVIDSFQAVTSKDIEDGKTYIETMVSNLHVLEEALGVNN